VSIYVGTIGSTLSKNLWKVNDALDTVEDSILVEGEGYDIRHIMTDSSGNLYVVAVKPSEAAYVEKFDSTLTLDTNWAVGGKIDLGVNNAPKIFVSPSGRIVVGQATHFSYYDSSGNHLWDSEITSGPQAVSIGQTSKNIYATYVDTSISKVVLALVSRLNGATIWTDILGASGYPTGGIVEDKINFSSPPHVYVCTQLDSVLCDNADTGEQIWSVGTQQSYYNLFSNSIALDSNGFIYVAGERKINGVNGWTYSVLKINPSDGQILGYFDTGDQAWGIYIDSEDNIFVHGVISGGKNVWKLNTSLIEQDSMSSALINTDIQTLTGQQAPQESVAAPRDKQYSKALVAIGNDQLYYEDSSGSMTQLSASAGELDVFDYLEAFEAFQKVIIVNGENLKIADFANTCLDLGEGNELISPPARGDVITQATSGASMIVDFVDPTKRYIYGYTTTDTAFETTAGYTLSSDDGTGTMDPNPAPAPVAVSEASDTPLWYDYEAYPDIVLSVDKYGQEAGSTKSFGSLPSKAYLGCLYRGRVVLSGNPNYPHQWYMSRQAYIWDWSYLANDAQTPVAGNNADAGELGDIITALIPYKDDFLIFGCANSLWLLRGDPAAGGVLSEIDLTVGMFGARSWCFDGDGNLYFWGNNGIYTMPAGFTGIKCLTENALPNIVADETPDPSTHRITMGYDKKRRGILVCITKLEDGSNSNYWYDLRTGGFFPEVYPNECGVYSIFSYDANDKDYADLLLGCRDGYIRKFLDSAKDDDSGDTNTAINSYCVLPITPMGADGDSIGRLTSLTITTAGGNAGGDFGDTDSVSYEIFVADDGETVLENIIDGDTARESGTVIGSGRSNRVRKRVRGAYLGIKLSNSSASETWAVDKIEGEIQPKGRIK